MPRVRSPTPAAGPITQALSRLSVNHSANCCGVSLSRTITAVFNDQRGTVAGWRDHRAQFKADRPDRPRVRKDFPDTVYWSPNVTTDATGTARVKVDYPDSLTTWRLTVRAVTADTRVGGAVARSLTTKDLILRVVTPRFLTEGDHVTIPSIVHNYLPQEKTVAVTVTADGLTPDAGATGTRSITVPQNSWPSTKPGFRRGSCPWPTAPLLIPSSQTR